MALMGWECPKCGRVMAPGFPHCTNCTGVIPRPYPVPYPRPPYRPPVYPFPLGPYYSASTPEHLKDATVMN